MKKRFVKQAKLPRGAYNKPLGEVLSVYVDPTLKRNRKGGEQNGKKEIQQNG